MPISSLYEITSNEKLLKCFNLAIAEARMTHSLLRAEQTSVVTARHNGHLEKLTNLGKEIDYLEAKLVAIKSKIKRQPRLEKTSPEYA